MGRAKGGVSDQFQDVLGARRGLAPDQEHLSSAPPEYSSSQDEMVPFSEVAHLVHEQVQYASRYHTGVGGYPVLSEGLRIKSGNVSDYHSLTIHQDDVGEFARRIVTHQVDMGMVRPDKIEKLERELATKNNDSFS